MLEDRPNIVHEMGGVFKKGKWSPVCHQLDVTNLNDLLQMQRKNFTPNYGAWCYFAFRISDVKKFPFPFFVRGDDVLFSLQNRFRISCINGVATWIDDFSIKESPFTRYLNFRAIQTINCLLGTMSLRTLIRSYKKNHRSALFSYNYSSAEAINASLYDYLHGPEIFENDMDGSIFRSKIKKTHCPEVLEKEFFDTFWNECEYSQNSNNRLEKIIRKISFNGFLIPSCFMRDSIVKQKKGYSANLSEIFNYKKVCYYDLKSNTAYIAEHNKKRLFLGLLSEIRVILTIFFQYNSAQKRMRGRAQYLMSEGFWRDVFSLKSSK